MVIQVGKDGKEQGGIIDDDVILPFRLEKTSIRGRSVRLGRVLSDIIRQHDYPPPVSYLLSEAMTLCLLLGAMLKYEGIFTLQIKGDGPIRTLVADVTDKGELRAYASFDAHAVKKLARRQQQEGHNYFPMLGKGHIAFTVDQGAHAERYQGIVELSGDTLLECIEHYFVQSEQIKTAIKMAIHPQDDQWRAGAIMVQHMPTSGGTALEEDEDEEGWNRTRIFLETCREDELLSPIMHSADILFRLFHEEGVRIYPATPVRHVCRCSRDRVKDVLRSISEKECRESLDESGKMEITCEFCSHAYQFDEKDIDALFAAGEMKN